MFPDGKWLSKDDKDTVGKARARMTHLLADHLEQQNRVNRFCTDPERFIRFLAKEHKGITAGLMLKCFGYWYKWRCWFTRQRYLPGRQELIAEIHQHQIWIDQYINGSALHDLCGQILDERSVHFNNAIDEAVLKIAELMKVMSEVDAKTERLGRQVNLFERMCDAIPERHKAELAEQIKAIRDAA